MIDLSKIQPVKKGELTHLQRQFIKWSKYWKMAKIKESREKYLEQTIHLGQMVERELIDKYRER